MLIVSRTMWARGISVLVVLGDFGFIWPRENWDNALDKLSKRLRRREQTLYLVDGNHEDFDRLYKFPVGEDGLRRLRPNIIHIPRGYRTTFASGRTLAALGGANSVDVGHRVEGGSWWPAEAITDADLAALGTEHADVLIGHDAPLHVPTLDKWLTETDHWWLVSGREYSATGRATFHRGFMQVSPRLYLGGHYHRHIDEQVTYRAGEREFESRVVILDKNGSSTAIGLLSNLSDLVFESQPKTKNPPGSRGFFRCQRSGLAWSGYPDWQGGPSTRLNDECRASNAC